MKLSAGQTEVSFEHDIGRVGPVLYAKDIARQYKCSIRRAQQMLVELEAKYGADVVGRVGIGTKRQRRYLTWESIAKFGPRHSRNVNSVDRRLNDIETLLESLMREIDTLKEKR